MRALLIALALISAGMAPNRGAHDAQAQETVSISGRVVNGTQGAELPAGLSVLMLVSEAAGGLAATGQTSTGEDGRFVFEETPLLDSAEYTLSVEHLGVFYGTVLTSSELGGELDGAVTLTVYETTQDASVVRVDRQVMVLAAVDDDGRLVSAIEFVQVTNPTDRTLLPDLTDQGPTAQGLISFLRFALPPEAFDLEVQSELPGGDAVSIGAGFALTSPVMPGSHQINFTYRFPYEGTGVSYRQGLVQGAAVFQVLAPARLDGFGVAGLDAVDAVNIQGTSYRAWEGRDFVPGQGLQLQLTGLPQPGMWARFGNTVTGSPFWLVAIPSALGATLAFLLIWGAIRRPQPAASAPRLAEHSASGPSGRATVVQALAALDERYERGDLGGDEYRDQRQHLTRQALGYTEEQGNGGPS